MILSTWKTRIFLTSSTKVETQCWCFTKLFFVLNFSNVAGPYFRRLALLFHETTYPRRSFFHVRSLSCGERLGSLQDDLKSLASCLIIRHLSAHFVLWTERREQKTRKVDRYGAIFSTAKADTFFKPPADSGGCLLTSGNICNIVEFLKKRAQDRIAKAQRKCMSVILYSEQF